jgi:hypothetical protein
VEAATLGAGERLDADREGRDPRAVLVDDHALDRPARPQAKPGTVSFDEDDRAARLVLVVLGDGDAANRRRRQLERPVLCAHRRRLGGLSLAADDAGADRIAVGIAHVALHGRGRCEPHADDELDAIATPRQGDACRLEASGHRDERGHAVRDDGQAEGPRRVAGRSGDGPGGPLDEQRGADHRLVSGVDHGAANGGRGREDERDLGALPFGHPQLRARHRPVGVVIGDHAHALGAHVCERERAGGVGPRAGIYGVRHARRNEPDGCTVHGVPVGVEDPAADLRGAILLGFRWRDRGRGCLVHRGRGKTGEERARDHDRSDGGEDHRRDEGRRYARSGRRRGHRVKAYPRARFRARPARPPRVIDLRSLKVRARASPRSAPIRARGARRERRRVRSG